MIQKIYFTIIAISTVAFVTACGSSQLPPSPLEGRGRTSGTSVTSGTVGQTNTGTSAITGAQGGKLTVSNVTTTNSGTSLSASYVNPNYGVNLNITAQSNSNNSDFYNEGYSNKGNNYSYYYAEGRCRSYSGTACDMAYYAIYVVDYDAAGSYMKTNNFAVGKALNGVASVIPVNKTDTYLSVDEVEQLFSANP